MSTSLPSPQQAHDQSGSRDIAEIEAGELALSRARTRYAIRNAEGKPFRFDTSAWFSSAREAMLAELDAAGWKYVPMNVAGCAGHGDIVPK